MVYSIAIILSKVFNGISNFLYGGKSFAPKETKW